MIVLRHASSGAGHLLSRICRSRIINAGDGMHEHPTQALLDAFTIREHKQRIDGLKVDDRRRPAAQPRAAIERAAADQARRRGLGVRAADAGAARASSGSACACRPRIDEAVADADVIMMLRIQQERMQGAFFPSLREYFNTFGMTEARVARAKPDVIIMHPGPMNRGVEIASDVADGPYSVILEQVANGVAVRMAVLYLLAGRSRLGRVRERVDVGMTMSGC